MKTNAARETWHTLRMYKRQSRRLRHVAFLLLLTNILLLAIVFLLRSKLITLGEQQQNEVTNPQYKQRKS